MTARTLALLPIAFVCLLLGACNVGLGTLQPGALQPNMQPGTLTPASLAASGLPYATQEKILAGVAKVQSAARSICGFLPLAEGVANVFIAQSNTSANVQGIANLTCQALAGAPSYTALGDRGLVRGSVPVNGVLVTVYGYRVR